MRMKHSRFGLIAWVMAGTTIAADPSPVVKPPGISPAVIEKIVQLVAPGQKAESVKPVKAPAFYEIVVGAEIVYVSEDGRYLFQGDLFDVDARANLTEDARSVGRKKLISGVDVATMITYPAKPEKYVVTIFTDIDCPYCRKLHMEMAEYNKRGITIRYLAFPRAGIGTDSYNKAVSAWCASNPAQAMTEAKSGKDLPRASSECRNPVRDHFDLARKMNITGTPALVLQDGSVLPGYMPPDRLLAVLKGGKDVEG